MKTRHRLLWALYVVAALFFVFGLAVPLALPQTVPQNVTKTSGTNEITASLVIGSGKTLTATGTGTIAATSVTGLSVAAGKTLTVSNSMTQTATDGATIAFGAGGTVLYSGGAYVSSIAGTANQISASAGTGAVTLSLAGPHNFTTLTSTAILLGAGTSPISASDMTYATPMLSVPSSFAITGAGSLAFNAGGIDQSITLTPSGTGIVNAVAAGLTVNLGSGTSTFTLRDATISKAVGSVFSFSSGATFNGATTVSGADLTNTRSSGNTTLSAIAASSGGSALATIQSGDGTTSARFSFADFRSLETTPQRWAAGMWGDKNFTIRDVTNNASLLTVTASTGATTFTGGAGNMTITAGTGNSRTLALQTTTSGGTATTALTLTATQGATFAGIITIPNGATIGNTGTGGMVLTASGSNQRLLLVPSGTGAVELGTDSVATNTLLFRSSSAILDTVNSTIVIKRQSGADYGALQFVDNTNTSVARVSAAASTSLAILSGTGAASWANFASGALTLGPNAVTITGGTGNMTIVAGSGASRTLTFQTTTSGSAATTALTLSATQTATFASTIIVGTDTATTPSGSVFRARNDTNGPALVLESQAAGKFPALIMYGESGGERGRVFVDSTTATSKLIFRNNGSTTTDTYLDASTFTFGSAVKPTVTNTTEATTGGAGSLISSGGIYAAKKIITASTLTTAAGVTWDFGAANVVSPTSPNRTLTVAVAGTTYYVAAKTTND